MALPLNLLLLMSLCVNKALVMPLPGLTANGKTVVWHSCLAHFQKWHMSFHRSWDALPGPLSYSLVLSGRMYLEPAWQPLTKTNTSPSLIAASSLHKTFEKGWILFQWNRNRFWSLEMMIKNVAQEVPGYFTVNRCCIIYVTSCLSSISSWKTLSFHLILLCWSSQHDGSSIFLWCKCFGVGAMKIRKNDLKNQCMKNSNSKLPLTQKFFFSLFLSLVFKLCPSKCSM